MLRKREVLCLIIIIFCACGPSAEDLTNDGWQLYEQEMYEQALDKFAEAVQEDDDYADAYNGQGWCYMELDSFLQSITEFDECENRDVSLIDAYAGRALVYTETPLDSAADHDQCIENADEVIYGDPEYVFAYRTSITIEDIRIVKAKSCCATGDFHHALYEIQQIDPAFDADPETPEGQQAILAKLESLIVEYL